MLLSARLTEYEHIENAVYGSFIQTAQYYVELRSGRLESRLRTFPELQLLAVLSYNLRYAYEFEFFRTALLTAAVRVQEDTSLELLERQVASYMIDAVRVGLNEKDVFSYLISGEATLPWVLRLGMKHVVHDEKLEGDKFRRFEKRIARARKGNKGLENYIKDVYSTSLDKAKILQETSKQ